MKITVGAYDGFVATVTALGAPAHIFYEGSGAVSRAVATYASGDVVYYAASSPNPTGTVFVAAYPAAVLVTGLSMVEV